MSVRIAIDGKFQLQNNALTFSGTGGDLTCITSLHMGLAFQAGLTPRRPPARRLERRACGLGPFKLRRREGGNRKRSEEVEQKATKATKKEKHEEGESALT